MIWLLLLFLLAPGVSLAQTMMQVPIIGTGVPNKDAYRPDIPPPYVADIPVDTKGKPTKAKATVIVPKKNVDAIMTQHGIKASVVTETQARQLIGDQAVEDLKQAIPFITKTK